MNVLPRDKQIAAVSALAEGCSSPDVLIKTGDRTFLQYLLKPLTDTIARSFRER